MALGEFLITLGIIGAIISTLAFVVERRRRATDRRELAELDAILSEPVASQPNTASSGEKQIASVQRSSSPGVVLFPCYEGESLEECFARARQVGRVQS